MVRPAVYKSNEFVYRKTEMAYVRIIHYIIIGLLCLVHSSTPPCRYITLVRQQKELLLCKCIAEFSAPLARRTQSYYHQIYIRAI